jgi:hypothetical protein
MVSDIVVARLLRIRTDIFAFSHSLLRVPGMGLLQRVLGVYDPFSMSRSLSVVAQHQLLTSRHLPSCVILQH